MNSRQALAWIVLVLPGTGPAMADNVSVAGLVQRLQDDLPIPGAETVLSATKQAGGILTRDGTTSEGLYNLTTAAILDTTTDVFVWCEYPRPTIPQKLSLAVAGNAALRTGRPHAIKVPPATGPLTMLQTGYALTATTETEALKVMLQLQTPEQGRAEVRAKCTRLLARFEPGEGRETLDQLQQLLTTVEARLTWVPQTGISRESLAELRNNPDFERAVGAEREFRVGLRGRLAANALQPADVNYLLGADLTLFPADWLLTDRTPAIIRSLLPEGALEQRGGLVTALPPRMRLEANPTTLLETASIENREQLKRWLENTPAAREVIWYRTLIDLPNLTERQRETCRVYLLHVAPLAFISPK